MKDDGTFVEAQPNSVGLYVRCDDIRSVEFISPDVPAGNTVVEVNNAQAQNGEASDATTT